LQSGGDLRSLLQNSEFKSGEYSGKLSFTEGVRVDFESDIRESEIIYTDRKLSIVLR